MRQILIKYEDITEIEALEHTLCAFKYDKERTGIITFKDDTVLYYSDRSKNPSVTLYKKEK